MRSEARRRRRASGLCPRVGPCHAPGLLRLDGRRERNVPSHVFCARLSQCCSQESQDVCFGVAGSVHNCAAAKHFALARRHSERKLCRGELRKTPSQKRAQRRPKRLRTFRMRIHIGDATAACACGLTCRVPWAAQGYRDCCGDKAALVLFCLSNALDSALRSLLLANSLREPEQR